MPTAPLPPITETARLAALYEVSQALGSTLKLDETLRIALDAAIRLTRAERGFLMLLDPATNSLVFRVARNLLGETLTEGQFEVSRTIITEVARTGTPVVTTDASSDPRFSQQQSVVGFSLRSILAVPLRARGEILGALYLDNKARRGLFTQKDLELLNTFASQAAVAIDNARLYTQTDQALAARVAELQTMHRIGRELNAALDMDKLADITLHWAITGCGAAGGWIGMLREDAPGVQVIASQMSTPSLGQVLALDVPRLHLALLSGEPQNFPADGAQPAALAVPMLRDKRVTALLLVERPAPVFPAEASDFLVRLADHAAIALENARLYAVVKAANDAKTKFVSTVSHELRIPMTSIKGYIELLKMVGPINDQQGQFIQTIKNNVERMSVLVSDLADISRIESGKLKTEIRAHALTEAVQETVQSLQAAISAKQQTLHLQVPADLPLIWVDKIRLIQILTNLLNNAHKYSPAQATLTLSAQRAPDAPSDFVQVEVQDTGIGIAPTDQAKLFSQFFRSDDQQVREQTGWGLGLHLAKRLVELLGGQITFRSTPGTGSTFSFTLPIAAPEAGVIPSE